MAFPAGLLGPAVLGAVVLVLVVSAMLWCELDTGLPHGDAARHYLALLRTVSGQGWSPDTNTNYPPLGYWLLALGCAWHPTLWSLPGAQGLMLLALCLFVWLSARRLSSSVAAGLAVSWLLSSPLISAILRTPYIDLTLTTLTAAVYYLLLRDYWQAQEQSSQANSPPYNLAAIGALVGAAALCKFGFFLYLGLPLVLLAFPGHPRTTWPKRALWIGLPCLAVAAPWYLCHPEVFIRMGSFLSSTAYVKHPAAPGSLAALSWLGWSLVNWLWGATGSLLMLPAIFGAFRKANGLGHRLVLCLALPLLTLVFFYYRAAHYGLPQLVPAALLLAAWGGSRKPRLLRWLSACLLSAALWLNLYPLSAYFCGIPSLEPSRLPSAFSFVETGQDWSPCRLSTCLSIDTRNRPLTFLVHSIIQVLPPRPDNTEPSADRQLFVVPGELPELSLGIAPELLRDLEPETLRLEVFRQGGRLRVGALGQDCRLEEVMLVLAGEAYGRELKPGQWSLLNTFHFPEGSASLWQRRAELRLE